MSESLPQGSFRWLTEEEASALDVTKMTAEQSTGYIYEVDLKYPEHLHLDHNSFPLAPQHLVVKHSMLSPYAQKCHKLLNQGKNWTEKKQTSYEAKKLCGSFLPKFFYVIHYRTLATYIKLGLQVTKVHRVLAFRQAPYLRPYIQLCTKLRKASSTDFSKRLYKLAANAIFGDRRQQQQQQQQQ